MSIRYAVLMASVFLASAALADDDKVKAAIGGGAGGAIGAVIGDELGDRNGAIVGAAVGGAVGAAIATDGDDDHDHDHHHDGHHHDPQPVVHVHSHPERFCPPGQAKKGRC